MNKAQDDQAAHEPSKDGEPADAGAPPAYQPPTLVYVGNVHALLAGSGPSPTSDGTKSSHNRT